MRHLLSKCGMRALTRYAAADIEETGLGLSDFGMLEVLLHKGRTDEESVL